MRPATLHYFHDPLCGWRYAAEPLVFAVAEAGIGIELHGGGLWDPAQEIDADKRSYIRASDERIGTITGQRFGAAYLDGLLRDPASVWWSRPTIAAVLAVEEVGPGRGLQMIAAIQHAHYVDGLRVVQDETLTGIAASIGIDGDAFRASVRCVPVDSHIARTRTLMRRFDLHGYPGFLLETGESITPLAHQDYYGRPAAFASATRLALDRHA